MSTLLPPTEKEIVQDAAARVGRCNEFIFSDGGAYFDSLLADIRQAQHTIELESYIFSVDSIGKKVVAALMRAARRGVKVRVLVDGCGTPWWGNSFADKLEKVGVQTRVFHPFPWQLWNWSRSVVKVSVLLKFLYLCFSCNSRNHRKVVLIDRCIAYVGSINIDSAHLQKSRGGHGWRDLAVRLWDIKRFPVLLAAFESAWTHVTIKERIRYVFSHIKANPIVRLNYNWQRRRILYRHMLKKIKQAKVRVWVTNAYFVPDTRLLTELCQSAKRGLDVRIILPRKSDILVMPWASAVFYCNLLKAGVKIFEYLPSVLHAKTLLIDDWMLVGSSNMNYRSLRHDLEADVNIRDAVSKRNVEMHFVNDLNCSEEVNLSNWYKKRPWSHRLVGRLVLYIKHFI